METFTLYHHPLSVCSMKVRLALEEKGLTWSDHQIDIVEAQEQLEPWYIKLNPKGVVPTLSHHDGDTKVITNSADIIRHIASLDEGSSLLPPTDEKRALMEKLISLADNIDLQILSYARHPSMEKSEKVLNARIEKSLELAKQHPDLEASYKISAQRSQKNKTFRVDPEHVGDIEKGARESLSFAEQQLAQSSFLAGEQYTLADVIWTVILARLELLGYGAWISEETSPLLSSYYQKMQSRKSFTTAQIQNQWWKK
ncbi:glutathione S-transferase family protein [Mariprofundus sp. NF]|nr:glutathione S-transferase family protein [Mariprofundus sp. NF]NWF38999.1 glutathione S-transferase family protein [Mariprofundus sp. NF]